MFEMFQVVHHKTRNAPVVYMGYDTDRRSKKIILIGVPNMKKPVWESIDQLAAYVDPATNKAIMGEMRVPRCSPTRDKKTYVPSWVKAVNQAIESFPTNHPDAKIEDSGDSAPSAKAA